MSTALRLEKGTIIEVVTDNPTDRVFFKVTGSAPSMLEEGETIYEFTKIKSNGRELNSQVYYSDVNAAVSLSKNQIRIVGKAPVQTELPF